MEIYPNIKSKGLNIVSNFVLIRNTPETKFRLK